MQRSGPPILQTFSDGDLAEDHLLCLVCRAPASTSVRFDLAVGARLDERFEQLGKLQLCAACAQRKAHADTLGRPLVALAFVAPLALVIIAAFTLPLTRAWMPLALFTVFAGPSFALIRAVRRARADQAIAVVLGGKEDRIELRVRPPMAEPGAARGPYRGAESARTEASAPSPRVSDALMVGLSFALAIDAVAAAWLYSQVYPVVVIDNDAAPASVSIDGRALDPIPGGGTAVTRLRFGDHEIAVSGSPRGDGLTKVHLGWGVSSMFSVQPGACHRRFGSYARERGAWAPAETDQRWFPIADETQVIRIPCVDLPPRLGF